MVSLEYFEFPGYIQENKFVHEVLLMFRIAGIIVYSNQKYKRLHLLRGLMVIILFLICSTMQVYALQPKYWTSIRSIPVSLATAIIYLSCVCQVLKLLFDFQEFVYLFGFIATNIKKLSAANGGTGKDLYKEYTFLMGSIHTTMCFVIIFGVFLAVISSFVNIFNGSWSFTEDTSLEGENVPFLFRMYPFRKFTTNFFIAYISPIFQITVAALVFPGWFISVIMLLLYPIFIFKLIKSRLENIGHLPHKKLAAEMKMLIRLQIQTTNYVKRMESFISKLIFIDFTLFSICICFLLYQFAESNIEISLPTVLMIIFLFVVSFMQFVYHIIATEICYQANTIATAFYLSNWYEFPLSIQKMGLILMIYSTKPIEMRAIFIEMHLSTFVSIMRGAYGFFTMLRNINH